MRHGETGDQDRFFEVRVSILHRVEVLHEFDDSVACFGEGILFYLFVRPSIRWSRGKAGREGGTYGPDKSLVHR